MTAAPTLRVIDSHTGGEPTRVLIDGLPADLAGLTPDAARDRLRRDFEHWRRAIVCEPRGSDVIVGAFLLAPQREDCVAGVVFCNNVGYLGMCGHGAIGVIETLRHLGRIGPGRHRLDTPVGVIDADLHEDGSVSIGNVVSYRHAANVALDVEGLGRIHGDIAWGGNWFFLVDDHGLAIEHANLEALMDASVRVRRALQAQGITGAREEEIDHVEFVGASPTPGVHARNFVLCPGLAYDRSPCGTGTSAKLACLAADGDLAPGAVWRQESVIASEFQGSYVIDADGNVLPTIRGRAYVVADANLLFDANDPFAWGIA